MSVLVEHIVHSDTRTMFRQDWSMLRQVDDPVRTYMSKQACDPVLTYAFLQKNLLKI